MVDYCVLCGVGHDTGECCGEPKDIYDARDFLLGIIDVYSGDDERFAREAGILRDFILNVAVEKISEIYRELLVGLMQGFKKVKGEEGSPDIIERLTCDRFS